MKLLPNIYILLFLLPFAANGQQTPMLTKGETIALALDYNYDIKVANYSLETAANNASIYNSGYIPSLSATGGANYNVTNTNATFADGSEQSASGLNTNSLSASVGLAYTLYDGNGRKYNYEILKDNYHLSDLQARQVIEASLINIFSIYYDIARLTQNQLNLVQSLSISKERWLRAQYSYEYGQNTQLDVLNAEVNFNTDSINYLNITQELANTKRNLNVLLGRHVDTSFEVDTTVRYASGLSVDVLLNNAMNNNVQILQNQVMVRNSENQIVVSKSGYLPKLNLNAGYSWDRRDNGAISFFSKQSSNGLNAGLGLTWNVFDGGLTRTRVQNSKIALENQRVLQDQNEQFIQRDVKNAWGVYENALFVLEAETKNLETNQRNFERTQEQYKLGQITSIVFREAQQNLLLSQLNYNQAKYQAKIAELALFQLSGDLLDADF